MKHAEAQEKLLAERYVSGRLTPAEAELFEEHFLHCQACLDDLETAGQMSRAMKRAASRDALAAGRLGLLAWLTRRATRFSALLAVVLTVGLGAFFLGRTDAPPAGDPVAQTNVPLLFLSPERSLGAEPSHRVEGPSSPTSLVLVLELEPPLLDAYRVVLHRAGAPLEPLWQSDGLVPNQLEALSISLPSRLLSPGDWILRVEDRGREGDSEASRLVALFPFRVLGPAPG